MEKVMDRRQRKTREAIFNAFISLLSRKNYNDIIVSEIINLANVGRATFYAHFGTKDFLLKDLCAQLFDHLFSNENKGESFSVFHCDTQDAAFLHLFKHIKKNDNNIAKLLSCKNNELFLTYFYSGVKTLVKKERALFAATKPKILPEEFWFNHITATFIETLRFWLKGKMKESPERITEYFFATFRA
ncbi:MAG: TetR/AcrR family transcriptional regulator [Clostridiales bacterium]|nr:TetR/AcrR family transcriptional regulator [Clostridiales bacterium]